MPPSASMTIDRDREQILRIAAKHGARNVRVFGSVVRGDDRADSDVDLLVEMAHDRSLLDLVGLEQALEELLRRHVDVLPTTASIPPFGNGSPLKLAPCEGRRHLPGAHPGRHRRHQSLRTVGEESLPRRRNAQDAIVRKLEITGSSAWLRSSTFS
jgi:predicted nucleotidyltransferase